MTPSDAKVTWALTHPGFLYLRQVASSPPRFAVGWRNARGEERTEQGALDYVLGILVDRFDSADRVAGGRR